MKYIKLFEEINIDDQDFDYNYGDLDTNSDIEIDFVMDHVIISVDEFHINIDENNHRYSIWGNLPKSEDEAEELLDNIKQYIERESIEDPYIKFIGEILDKISVEELMSEFRF